MIALYLVIAALATYRVARIITEEEGPFEIFARLRRRVADDQTWIARGLHCPFCVGFWVAGVFVVYLIAIGEVPITLVPILWPAVAGAAVKIHEWWKR